MEPEVAVHTDKGSPEAQFALAALARALNINENTLKTALNDAFELLPTAAGSPMLALHLSFVRLSYHVDRNTLYDIMGAFRQTFGAALSDERVNYATTQAVSSSHHGVCRAPPIFAQLSRNAYISPSHTQTGPPLWYASYTGNVSSSGS